MDLRVISMGARSPIVIATFVLGPASNTLAMIEVAADRGAGDRRAEQLSLTEIALHFLFRR